MRVIVLGSGVIGVCTAYSLARAGASVTVIEQESGPGLGTSFANAGQISPGYASPWAAPGIPLKALSWLFQRHAPLSIRPDGSLWQWQWLARMLRECDTHRYAINKERMVRVAEYSRDCLRRWRDEIQLSYEGRSLGTLQIFRTTAQLHHAAHDVRVLQQCGVAHAMCTPAECVEHEPALAGRRHLLTGGLHLPGDETGDCHLFTRQLSERAAMLGVRFRYGTRAECILSKGDRVTGVQCATPEGTFIEEADAYVVALASYSRHMLRSLGLSLPVYPVKGYSLTVPIAAADKAPRSTVLDETYKVALTRFDQRLRVGGMAELAGFDLSLSASRRATLEHVVHDLFPHAGPVEQATFWTGLRPMTPDGTPIIGPTRLDKLWLNTGHGTLGWTMACGSGELLCDWMLGRQTAIRADDLSLHRYNRAIARHSAAPAPRRKAPPGSLEGLR